SDIFTGSNPATTDANGIAYIDYTASPTSGGIDDIDVESAPASAIQINLAVTADNVSYYSFNPSTDQSFIAGDGSGQSFVVTAFDQYDNTVGSADSIIFSAEGSATATFSSNDTLGFAGGSTVNVTVEDNTAGSFSIKAKRFSGGSADASVNGTSGLITVSANSASTLTGESSSSPIIVGALRRLQVRVDDQFGNNVPSASVTFSIISGG
ncbi:MAG: hypothetical protein GY806_21375, partial [Gammaproteobacteria bacterium]|nr:hypothetical protein [Gammaproteobacteria bacterium]